MMSKVVLLIMAAAIMASAGPALAQGALSDVPAQHWASGAVKELQLRGILTGYPDGTFGGKRAVSRYEFALAGQRVLQDVQHRIDAAGAASHPGSAAPGVTREEAQRLINERTRNLPTRTEVNQLRLDVDEMRRSMSQLQSSAATLRSEVDSMKQQVGGLGNRLSGIRSQLPLGSWRRP
jgi:polyhydroxyalkanoate synthesis regulator phasin